MNNGIEKNINATGQLDAFQAGHYPKMIVLNKTAI